MNFAKKVLAAGCLFTMLTAPIVSFATPAQTSPRAGVPVVSVTASKYSSVAISKVSNYVNVRSEANTTSTIVGKIYNNCAATILATVDGEGGKWYKINSGTVTGYIKAQYFVTGSEAEKIAKEIGTTYVTVDATTLRLREEPNTDSRILTLLSQEAEYIAIGQEGDFVKIEVDASLSGYVHKDYVKERVEFDSAVSLEEEAAAVAEAERLRKEAEDAIAHVNQLKAEAGLEAAEAAAASDTVPNAGMPEAVANGSAAVYTATTEKEGVTVINSDSNAGNDGAGLPEALQTEGAPAAAVTNAGGTAGPGSISTSGPGSAAQTTNSGVVISMDGPGSISAIRPGSAAQAAQTKPNVQTKPAAAAAQVPSGANITSSTRNAIVAYAKQFLGNKYVYGGTSLTDGTDCSGFTMRIYEQFGINTGRSSRDQAAKGREIALSEIQPGDLIFYANGDYINHVALYIGGGQVIHASNSKTGIIISTAYYRTPYKAVTFLN